MTYLIDHICTLVGGSFLQFRQNDSVEHLLLDSRKLIFPETSLFFALEGPRRNGNQFAGELYGRGVRNFVVSQPPEEQMPEANIILVPDALAALQQLAAFHRQRFDIPVIGITGSNGKTIVKEWLNQLLEDRFHIVRSPRSYNSQIGVPLSVWQINSSHELGIFEAGISRPSEMGALEKIIAPTIGIITSLGEAHGENFQGDAHKAREKIALFLHCGLVIYPGDNPVLGQALAQLAARERPPGEPPLRLFSWGSRPDCSLVVQSVQKTRDSALLTLAYRGHVFSESIPFCDDASISNALSCISALLCLEVPAPELFPRMQRLTPLAMRLELKSGINHCALINDSYSADLSSLKIALDFMAQQHQHPGQIVIVSDFLESGFSEAELYAEMARSFRQKRVSRVIGIGPKISAWRSLFGAPLAEALFYPSTEAFLQDFHRLHFRDETILIKGARVFEFEKIDRLLSEQVHQTVLEIDLDAMTANLKAFQQILHPSTRLMAMVKAFAYGSGSYEIASLLQFHKVDYLAVAYTDEGVELRKAGIRLPIMVMNTDKGSFDALVQFNLEPVIYSFDLFGSLEAFLRSQGLAAFAAHIELETGMNRLGFAAAEMEALCQRLADSPFKVQSVFSHLAASEEAQHDGFTALQAARFEGAASALQAALPYKFLKHLANTGAIIRHPELQYDMVRLGIGLYGIDPAASRVLDLREVSTLKSTISQIKKLSEGETVGYNRKGEIHGDRLIATVRIGYADGYPRLLGNGNGKMWVHGHLAPVTGTVCMDMTMIDVTGIAGVREGDEVIVLGPELPVTQVAHWAQTIPYEILTGVSHRVKRVYYER